MLTVFEAGNSAGTPVLIVNPVGIPALLVSRLMHDLSRAHRVVTWHQRGFETCFESFRQSPNDISAFANDTTEVWRRYLGGPCHIVAVCSGAYQAVKAVSVGNVPVRSIVLVSPALRFEGHVPGLYECTAVPFMADIAKDASLAQLLIDISSAPANAHADTQDETLIKSADRHFLSSIDSVLVQAHSVTQFYSQSVERELQNIDHSVLIVGAQDDEMASSASVQCLAQRLPNCRVHERASGGHHLVFLDPTFRAVIADFLALEA